MLWLDTLTWKHREGGRTVAVRALITTGGVNAAPGTGRSRASTWRALRTARAGRRPCAPSRPRVSGVAKMISHDLAGPVNATTAVLPASARGDKSVKAGYCQNVAPDPGSGYAPELAGCRRDGVFSCPDVTGAAAA